MTDIAEELREYTAMKYAGDCKCGKCQLVPRELVDRIYKLLCSDTGWQPISTLPDYNPDPRMVLFNPCDGVHPYLLTTPPRKHAQIKAGQWGYTHWRILSRPVTA